MSKRGASGIQQYTDHILKLDKINEQIQELDGQKTTLVKDILSCKHFSNIDRHIISMALDAPSEQILHIISSEFKNQNRKIPKILE